MKYIYKIFLVFSIFAPIFLTSCSKDNSTNPTDNTGYQLTCVVNGGGYTNQTYTFNVAAGSILNPQENVTGCSFTDAAGDAAVITFGGSSKNTYTIDDNNNIFMITLNGSNIIFGLTSGTIKVTSYGNVGGDVAGTFSGAGTVYKDGQTFDITITGGVFKAKRLT